MNRPPQKPNRSGRMHLVKVVVPLVLLLAVFAVWFKKSGILRVQGKASQKQQIRLGLPIQPSGALAIIAMEKGFFTDEQLDVQVKPFPNGALALGALVKGEVDISESGETPIVVESFSNTQLAILATVGTDALTCVVGRRDHGINSEADLRGKKIAAPRGSSAEFFLHIFLLGRELKYEDVDVQYLTYDDIPRALTEERVDASTLREPEATETIKELGSNAIVFSDSLLYRRAETVVAMRGLLEKRPGAAEAFLRGVLKAEDYARRHPELARKILARRLGLSKEEIATAWRKLDLRVSLDQSIIPRLEDEATWAKENGFVPESSQVPNFLRLVEKEPLMAEAPEAVTIL